MNIGDILQNIHTGRLYTLTNIEKINNYPNDIIVYEVANDNFESHRFAITYLENYKLISQEEE